MVYVLSSVLSFTTFCGSSSPKSDVSASESNFFEAVMLVAFPSSDVTLLVLILREVSLSQTHCSSSSESEDSDSVSVFSDSVDSVLSDVSSDFIRLKVYSWPSIRNETELTSDESSESASTLSLSLSESSSLLYLL